MMMTIEQNIKARHAAEVVALLADEEAEEHGNLLWQELARIVNVHVPDPYQRSEHKLKPMTNAEAKSWGQQTRMPFGEFVGMQVDAVPLDRLQWYADQTFTDELRRYLGSNRIKSEQGEDGDV